MHRPDQRYRMAGSPVLIGNDRGLKNAVPDPEDTGHGTPAHALNEMGGIGSG
jgi:hypothetical protein